MKKRVLSMVLACLLALSAAACGKEGSKQKGQAAAGGTDAARYRRAGRGRQSANMGGTGKGRAGDRLVSR